MWKISIYSVIVLLLCVDISEEEANVLHSPTFVPIIIHANYSQQFSRIINSTVEYVFLYPVNNVTVMETIRIQVDSNASHSLPLVLVVRQSRGILSWQVPLLIDSIYFGTSVYNKTTQTLCPQRYYKTEPEETKEFISVSVYTSSPTNIIFGLNVFEDDFYLSLGKSRTTIISPAQPIYFGYTFAEESESASVIVHIEADNDICMIVSIQNTSCPVFDLETNIKFSGQWQTVTWQGGITVRKEHYPSGFFVVLVVKGDDTDCTEVPSTSSPRSKNVTVTIKHGIVKQDYILAFGLALSAFLVFCISYIIGIVVSRIKEGKKIREDMLKNQETDGINEYIPSPSTIEEAGPSQWASAEEDSSLDEDDIDIMEDALSDKDVIRTKIVLSVCDLARKNPKILQHKSRLYLYYLITVAIFYALPVIQLVITYQNVLHITGNDDMCYYNFLCAHPFGQLSDVNHVFSNCGYILLGLLFIFFTYTREHNELDKERNKCYGIPQHYGLFYAMGTALIMEGVLSASYHVCPNRSNFQFDSSFMYIIAVLCMIKIYQTRHPDINARAPVTFGVLALIIVLGLVGVLNGSKSFWVIFTITHLLVCLILTLKIYYMGRWKFNKSVLNRVIQVFKHDAHSGLINFIKPLYPARFTLLVLANCCNIALAVYGNVHDKKQDFATFLLAILMSNLILYTFFYIVMKLCHRERILLQPLIHIILSMFFWGAAMYFFVNRTISWNLTPAQSRLYNRPCKLLNFFDNHDIWHFLSALAMFFSFTVLLTLDDDLINVHRSQIAVF